MFGRWLDRLEESLVMLLMAGATLTVFIAVVHRYLASLAIPGMQDWLLTLDFGWAQELCIIMFVWMAKFGAAYGVRTGIHVGVDVLINRLPAATRGRFIIFGLAAGALFTAVIGSLGAHFVWHNGLHYALRSALGLSLEGVLEGPTTPDLEWPTWIVYLAIPLGSYLMCLRFVQVLNVFRRTGELPQHDHGHVEGVDQAGHLPVDANPYNLDDELHPHDLKHHPDRPSDRQGQP